LRIAKEKTFYPILMMSNAEQSAKIIDFDQRGFKKKYWHKYDSKGKNIKKKF
jgi:hypothetical protein